MNGEITSIWLCMHSRLGLVNAHWLLSKLVTFDLKKTVVELQCAAAESWYYSKITVGAPIIDES